MSTRRILPLLVALFLGACVGMLIGRTPRPDPNRVAAPAGAILVSHPDASSPSGRRIVRLAAIDPAKLPRNRDDQLELPPRCWMVVVEARSYYGMPE
jgi:hypothetical protein